MDIHDFTKKWGTEGWRLLIQRHIDQCLLDRNSEMADTIHELFNELQEALESENNTRAETFAECAEYCENVAPGLHTIAESAYEDAGKHFRSEEKKYRFAKLIPLRD